MDLLKILLFVHFAGQLIVGTFARAMPKFPFGPHSKAELAIEIPEEKNINHFESAVRKKRYLWLIPVALIGGLAIGKYLLSSENESAATYNYNTSNTNTHTHYNNQKSLKISLKSGMEENLHNIKTDLSSDVS